MFDDFDAHAAGADVGPVVTVAPVSGSNPFSGDVTFRATATGNATRIEFRLNNVLRSVSASSPASWTLDTTTLSNGTYTLTVRAFDAAGNIGSADYTFTTNNAGLGPILTPDIPRHYTHIRIAQLAYSGNPMGYVRAEPAAKLRRSGHPEPELSCPPSSPSRRTRRN